MQSGGSAATVPPRKLATTKAIAWCHTAGHAAASSARFGEPGAITTQSIT
jgi:hypothetical protein